MKIIDLQLNIDGLLIEEGRTVDDFISEIQKIANTNYDITYEILHEEEFDE